MEQFDNALTQEELTQDVTAEETVEGVEPVQEVEQPAPVAEPTPVVQPVVKPVMAPAPVMQKLIVEKEDNSFEGKIAKLRQTGTTAQKSLIAKMDAYFAAMKPGLPVDPVKGGSHQLAFYMALRQVCETESAEFKSLFTLILEYFRNHKDGVLGDRYVFRFTETIKLSNAALKPYLSLLNLIRVASEAGSRAQVLKQVDLNRSLETGFSEAARQRINQFFHG